MAACPMPFFPMYAQELLADGDFITWNPAARGCWLTLSARCWIDGDIPDDLDVIGRLCGEMDAQAMLKHWLSICKKFHPCPNMPGRLFSPRIEEERRKALDKAEQLKNRGSAGAMAKWAKYRLQKEEMLKHCLADAKAMLIDATSPSPSPSPSPNNNNPLPPSGAGDPSADAEAVADENHKVEPRAEPLIPFEDLDQGDARRGEGQSQDDPAESNPLNSENDSQQGAETSSPETKKAKKKEKPTGRDFGIDALKMPADVETAFDRVWAAWPAKGWDFRTRHEQSRRINYAEASQRFLEIVQYTDVERSDGKKITADDLAEATLAYLTDRISDARKQGLPVPCVPCIGNFFSSCEGKKHPWKEALLCYFGAVPEVRP